MFGICRPNSIYIWPGSASLPIYVESFGDTGNEVGVEFVTPKPADNAAFADEPSLLS